MSALSDIREKDFDALTKTEKCIVEVWEMQGLEWMAEEAATEQATLRAELATAKARAKTAEENWHKNEAKTGHMNNALTTCVMFLVNTNTITEEKQVELIKSLQMAGLVDLADSVSVGGFASVFEGVA